MWYGNAISHCEGLGFFGQNYSCSQENSTHEPHFLIRNINFSAVSMLEGRGIE